MSPVEEPATEISPRLTVRAGKSRVVLVAILIAGLAVVIGAREWGIRHDIERWEKYRAEWEAKGEDFGTARWMPPPVANAADNFAAHPLISGLWDSAGSAASLTLAGIDPATLPGMQGEEPADPDESWFAEHRDQAAAFLTAVKPMEDFLAEFRIAATRGDCRFEFNPKIITDVDGDGRTARFAKVATLLSARAEACLAAGDEAGAVADLEAVFRAGGHLRRQREILLTVVGVGCERKAMHVVTTALGKGRLSADSRARLLRAFPAHADLGAEIGLTLRLARGGAFAIFDALPVAAPVRSGGMDYYYNWMFPPRRVNAINKWILSRRLEPFLASGGNRAEASRLREKRESLISRDPATGLLASAFLSLQSGIPESLLATEEQAEELRAELAK